MRPSKQWLEYKRLLVEMEREREAGKLTKDDESEYMRDLNYLYPKLALHEYGEAADIAVYFYKRRFALR